MKLTQMRDMVAVVERGSLRAAARHLDLAQPALTRSIGALERELGVTLFEREARGMVLTPAGKLFHRRASAVITAARTSVANRTVSAAVAGTSATLTSRVGNFDDGRTSQ